MFIGKTRTSKTLTTQQRPSFANQRVLNFDVNGDA